MTITARKHSWGRSPACLITALLLATPAVEGGGGAGHWSYGGATGPANWGQLDSAFARCGDGSNQSPVDLANAIAAELAPFEILYSAPGGEVINSGHGIHVDAPPGNRLLVDGREYALLQYHFHLPSEHLLEGESLPLEAHLVHIDADGRLAVLGVLFVEGESNAALEAIAARVPAAPHTPAALPTDVDPAALLPVDRELLRNFYRYNGSLTTPPCTEGVRWLVLETVMTASAAQLERLRAAAPEGNNRPPQPLYARPLLR